MMDFTIFVDMDHFDIPPEPKLPFRYRVQSFLYQIKSFRVRPFLQDLKLKLFNKEIVLSGDCSLCGACCKKINLQTANGWIQSIEEFQALCAENPEYDRYNPVGYDDDGTMIFHCTWLQEDNTCKDHENRLDTCRDYPNKELLFYNGNPVAACSFYAKTRKKLN